jgi:hypothetical protein
MFQGFALCMEGFLGRSRDRKFFSLDKNQAKSLQDIQARNRADAYSKNVRPTVFWSATNPKQLHGMAETDLPGRKNSRELPVDRCIKSF